MHIIWKRPSLNQQQKHVCISVTVYSSFKFNYCFHFTLSIPFIPSGALLSFWTFDLFSRCILDSICNHNNFVNYYFILQYWPDDGRSITRNVAHLNILVHYVINVLYYEYWTDKQKYFYVCSFIIKFLIDTFI